MYGMIPRVKMESARAPPGKHVDQAEERSRLGVEHRLERRLSIPAWDMDPMR